MLVCWHIVNDDSDLDDIDKEFTREIKALMISNPKKFFKKNFSKFNGNKSGRGDNAGGNFKN